jgi:hypothetical protein
VDSGVYSLYQNTQLDRIFNCMHHDYSSPHVICLRSSVINIVTYIQICFVSRKSISLNEILYDLTLLLYALLNHSLHKYLKSSGSSSVLPHGRVTIRSVCASRPYIRYGICQEST